MKGVEVEEVVVVAALVVEGYTLNFDYTDYWNNTLEAVVAAGVLVVVEEEEARMKILGVGVGVAVHKSIVGDSVVVAVVVGAFGHHYYHNSSFENKHWVFVVVLAAVAAVAVVVEKSFGLAVEVEVVAGMRIAVVGMAYTRP